MKLRSAVALCELDGLSRTVAAARLGIAEGTVAVGNCIRGKVIHINPAGSLVKVRADDFGLVVNMNLTPDHHKKLMLVIGEFVFLSPKTAKMFEPEYTI